MKARRILTVIGVVIVMLFSLAPSLWAVPGQMSYQGQLTDVAGRPVDNPSLSMTFRIYAEENGGVAVWEETQSVMVDGGMYNVLLGSVMPISGEVFSEDGRWLEVEVAGEVLSPRQRMGSVGYAMRAEMADTVAMGGVMTNMLADGAVTVNKIQDGAVLAEIKDNDGAGSGLDADMVDGSHAAAFASDARVAALEAQVATLQATVAQLTALLQNVTRNGNDIYFDGVNLHVRNGQGNTTSMNSYGNLIVGYNELRGSGADVRSGSHNIVVGRENNYASYGGLVAALHNSISAPYATVSGGVNNTASGENSNVSGGFNNTASGNYSFIGGGGGTNSTFGNKAIASYSAILGGSANQATGDNATVSGGYSNSVSGSLSSITGGSFNSASSQNASVSGGLHNTASGLNANVSGGSYNTASGNYSFIGGGGGVDSSYGNKAFAHYSAILGGTYNIAGDTQLMNNAIGPNSTVSGGKSNTASGDNSSVSGGQGRSASGQYNWAGGQYSSGN